MCVRGGVYGGGKSCQEVRACMCVCVCECAGCVSVLGGCTEQFCVN